MDEGQLTPCVLANMTFLFFNDLFLFLKKKRPYPNITRLYIKWKYWGEPQETANTWSFLPYKKSITYASI